MGALNGVMMTKNALDSAGLDTNQQPEDVSSLMMDAKLKDWAQTYIMTGELTEKSAMSLLLAAMSSLEQDTH
jgi:hypothetical protein